VCKRTFVVVGKPGKKLRVLDFGYEFLFTSARTSPFDMPFSLRPHMCYIFVQMAFPVFHEFDADGTIRTNGWHWDGFPRLVWEALSTAGYLTPPTYEVSEIERYGVPRCRVIITMLPHPDHTDWFDLSFIYWGFITHEAVESAALRVLTDFCDHNPTVVALSLSVRTVSCCESSRPGMVGLYGSPTGAVVTSRAAGCHANAGSLS
jgi:hypothetical protein